MTLWCTLSLMLQLYDEASNQAVVLDLPAYNSLLKALLEAKRLEEATEVLREVVKGEDVCPMEQTFLPVLVELVKSREYDDATQLMRQGQDRGVEFTSESFHPLLVLAEKDTDSLIKFLSFVEDSWEEYKVRRRGRLVQPSETDCGFACTAQAIDDFDPEEDGMDDPENPFRSL